MTSFKRKTSYHDSCNDEEENNGSRDDNGKNDCLKTSGNGSLEQHSPASIKKSSNFPSLSTINSQEDLKTVIHKHQEHHGYSITNETVPMAIDDQSALASNFECLRTILNQKQREPMMTMSAYQQENQLPNTNHVNHSIEMNLVDHLKKPFLFPFVHQNSNETNQKFKYFSNHQSSVQKPDQEQKSLKTNSTSTTKPSNLTIQEKNFQDKRFSKPMIEKRRRDRINRCLSLLKEFVIDSKRYPVPNINKSRFEKADILEITVKYLESLMVEERRFFQCGFELCLNETIKLFDDSMKTVILNDDQDDEKIDVCQNHDDEDSEAKFDQKYQLISKKFIKHLSDFNESLKQKTLLAEKNLKNSQVSLNRTAKLNVESRRTSSISDSDQYSTDEFYASDKNYSSDNEPKLPLSVIKHTKSFCSKPTGHSESIIDTSNNLNSQKNLIKKLDRLNLEGSFQNNSFDQPLNLEINSKRLFDLNGAPLTGTSSCPSSASSFSSSSSNSSIKSDYQSSNHQPKESPSTTSSSSCSMVNQESSQGTINQTWPSSPFYTELTFTQPQINYVGNERNGNLENHSNSFDVIWRPWGCGHH